MEQSPNFKSNLNSEMSDLVHQAEEWAQMRQSPSLPPPQDAKMEMLFKQILCKASLLLLEKSGVKSVEEFHAFFDPLIQSTVETEEEEIVEVQRQIAVSPVCFDEFQNNSKIDWIELLDEPFNTMSPINCRRRTSLFSDLQLLSPIASEASQSPEKMKRPSHTPLRFSNRPLFNSMSTPKTPWRRGNSMYVEDTPNKTMVITPQKALSASRLTSQSPAPLAGEPPLENRASRLRRLKMEEKMRDSQIGWK